MSPHIGLQKLVLTHLLDRFVDRDAYMHARGGGIGQSPRDNKEKTVPIPERFCRMNMTRWNLIPHIWCAMASRRVEDDEDEDIAGLSDSDESQFAESEDSEHDGWDDVGDGF